MSLFKRRSRLSKLFSTHKPKHPHLPHEEDLPLKLPPKKDLSRTYIIKKGHKASLITAIALAIITPILAQVLRSYQFETQSKASEVRTPTISQLVIVDATTGTDYQVLDEATALVNLNDLPRLINIRADVEGRVGSVSFYIDETLIRTEERPPYALAGDEEGRYNSWEPVAGTALITAVPYSLPNTKGEVGAPFNITLTFSSGFSSGLSPATLSNQNLSLGDCNGDNLVDAGDLNALKLEIGDGDGNEPSAAPRSIYAGTAMCDANQDQVIDEADNECIQRLILGESCN